MFRKGIFAAVLLAGAALGAQVNAQSITIAPGSTPAGGYLPLSLFGISPIGGMTGDGHATFNIPAVMFAGQSWSQLQISENGFVVLGGASVPGSLWTSANLSLPTASVAAPIIAPYWNSIDSSSGGISIGTLTDGVNSWVVVDWAGVTLSNSSVASFELWLGYTGGEDVTIGYGTALSAAAFTIGAQDASGTIGTNYLYNSGTIANGTQLRVTSSGLPIPGPRVPEPATWAMMIAGFGLAGAALRRRGLSVRFA